jgi:CRP-like cAMP-binding protein/Fe-S-cluster-containing hydrogenase component 2/ferredoxin
MSPDGSAAKPTPQAQITLTIDGKPVTVPQGTTIFDAARLNGIPIPTLCHQQNENPVGVCRVCVVDVGARVYAASCIRQAEAGMNVKTDTGPLDEVRRTLLELLMADHPSPCTRQQHSGDCELERLAAAAHIDHIPFAKRTTPRGHDDSSLSIAVDHEACILCDRCIRGCDYIRNNWVLARRGKGYQAGIAFDLNDPMGDSSCVSCGECMVSCPTGALTNKRIVGQEGQELKGDPVNTDFLLELPVFKNVSGNFLSMNRNAIVERHFKAGDIICREGDFGATAFYILEGTIDVYISTPMAHVKTQDSSEGWLQKLRSFLTPRTPQSANGDHHGRTSIPIDANIDLPLDKPIAQLGPGELFGEMTCMSYYPRSATVRAKTDCTMLEMLRNVLDIMQRNKTFREQLERTYKQRALDSHLKSVPVLSSLTPEFIAHLKERVELIRYLPGQVICAQGDQADGFYLVRLGFVKVSQQHPGGDVVLAYLSKGGYFGEMAFLLNAPRQATCTALDHVEVVRIPADDFRMMLEQFPDIRAKLEAVAHEHLESNRQRMMQVENVPVDQFLNQGLMEAQSLLVLDLDRCTRCDQCVRACADAHDGVTRLVRDGLRFDRYLVATSCRSCRDPLCMVGCPVGSIRRRNSMEIVIEDWCIGCGQCANNCPYGNINMHPFPVQIQDPAQPTRMIASTRLKATGCDLCTEHAEPSCVYACPHDAAHRVNPPVFFADLLKQGTPADSGAPVKGRM